jgi:hypothetical protein
MKKRVTVLAICAAVAALPSLHRAFADAALAIGTGPRGAWASGFQLNAPSFDAARPKSIEGCLKSAADQKGLGREWGSKNCKVVATFRDECVAVALDLKDGEIGAGWAIGKTQAEADRIALERCQRSATRGRADFCRVTDRHCDGSAK